MKLMHTVAGRFLVEERVADLVERLERDLLADLEGADGERYRIRRGILERILERHATPAAAGTASPAPSRDLVGAGP